MSQTAEWRESSQQVLSICGNSFKTVEKAFQVMLVERMPSVCKAIKAKGGYLKNLKYKIYFDLFNTFLATTWFHMLFHSFDIFTLILQCKNKIVQIKKTPWMSRCSKNFWPVVYNVVYLCFKVNLSVVWITICGPGNKEPNLCCGLKMTFAGTHRCTV